jgi:hypothetical protein
MMKRRTPSTNANAVTEIYDRLREELARERAKVDKLEKERDNWHEQFVSMDRMFCQVVEAKSAVVAAHEQTRAELAKMTEERDEARESANGWLAEAIEARDHSVVTRRRALLLGADRREWKRVAMKRAAANEQLRHGLGRATRTIAKLRRAVLGLASCTTAYYGISLLNQESVTANRDERAELRRRAQLCDVQAGALMLRARNQSNDDAKGATK